MEDEDRVVPEVTQVIRSRRGTRCAKERELEVVLEQERQIDEDLVERGQERRCGEQSRGRTRDERGRRRHTDARAYPR